MSNRTEARLVINRTPWVLLVIMYAFTLPYSNAQSSDNGIGELGIFGGAAFGPGSHGTVGGSTGLAFSRYGIVLLEAAYVHLDKDTMRPRPADAGVRESRLFDFNVSCHVRVPVRERWAPYGILGGGLLWNNFGYTPVVGIGAPVVTRRDEFNFGFHTGGGLRYYFREDWGIRSEFKVIVGARTYTRVSIGIVHTTFND
jgi:hypothetical protein